MCGKCNNLRLSCEWGGRISRGAARQNPLRQYRRPKWPLVSVQKDPDTVDEQIDKQAQIQVATNVPDSDTGLTEQWLWSMRTRLSSLKDSFSLLRNPEGAITCANSLTLANRDMEYFQYFPDSSLIFYFMKGWDWSSFGYIYKSPAMTSKVIMRMILAISATDMSRQHRLQARGDYGQPHYALAVRDFRGSLACVGKVSQSELQVIFQSIFLMIMYEWLYGSSIHHLQMHLCGLRSFLEANPAVLETHVEPVSVEDKEVSLVDPWQPENKYQGNTHSMLAQLLLWSL